MSNPMNDTCVRIPAHAHGILSVEKTRIRIEEKKHIGIGTLAGLYIERAEMLEEALAALKMASTLMNANCLLDAGNPANIAISKVLTKARALP